MSDRLKGLNWEKREHSYGGRGDRRVSWIVHGKTLSVEFWLRVYASPAPRGCAEGDYRGEPCYAGGFEVHSRSGKGDPDQPRCTVLGAPCWHDGSSLSASEFFSHWGQSDEEALLEVARWVRSREADAEDDAQ